MHRVLNYPSQVLNRGQMARSGGQWGVSGPQPGQYFTDFTEYAVDLQPADWTKRLEATFDWVVRADAGATGGKALVAEAGSADARNGLSWDALDGVDGAEDATVLYRVKFPSLTSAELLAMFRGEGDATSATQTLYRHGVRPGTSSNSVTMEYYNGGSFGLISRIANYPFQADVWYKVEAKVKAGVHSLRIWADGEERPDWQLNDQETTPVKLGSGWIGLFKFRTPAASVDWFSVGIGDTPPYDPSEPLVTHNAGGVMVEQDFDSGSFA